MSEANSKTKQSFFNLKKKKISSKLTTIVAINSLTILLLGLVAFFGLNKLFDSNNQIASNSKLLITQLELEKEKDNINGDIYIGVLLNKDDAEEVKNYKNNFYSHINLFKKNQFILSHITNSDYTKEIHKLIPDLKEFSRVSIALVHATINGKMEAFELMPMYKELYEKISKSSDDFSAKLMKESEIISKENKETSVSINLFIIGFSLVALFLAFFVSIYINRMITMSVSSIQSTISKLLIGELSDGKDSVVSEKEDTTNDELVNISYSLHNYMHSIKMTADYAREIGKGNFDLTYNPLSDKDELGLSLLEMKSSLENVAEEDKKRNWATEGMAKFGDILRGNNEGIEVLADNIISNLVKYLGANQGALFIVNDVQPSDIHLELVACYAWNKKKYIHMRIEEGEGLVGQAWQENDTLYITDVPDNYVRITSGLGDANPKSFIVVPLVVNDETFGVIEIASFTYFEQYHIDFVNKLAESIASTLSTAKINERTKILLEQSQQQTEEMRAQEEEMRQNMEEMMATQEEMEKKERRMKIMVDQMTNQEDEMIKNMQALKDKEKETEDLIESMKSSQLEIERLALEQQTKDAETKKVYEGEINAMYDKWYAQLKRMEQLLNTTNN
jgi:putative methionine-R-sulfoxide reductase with GAF domain